MIKQDGLDALDFLKLIGESCSFGCWRRLRSRSWSAREQDIVNLRLGQRVIVDDGCVPRRADQGSVGSHR